MKKLILGGVCIIFIGLLWYMKGAPCADFYQGELKTPTQSLSLAFARTGEEQTKGLGGCREVPNNAGMYFEFPTEQNRTFWMKGMRIPIDIVWISRGVVTGIEKNVPALPLTMSDSTLPTYTSPRPADAVLEVGAGKAEQYGISEGVVLRVDRKE